MSFVLGIDAGTAAFKAALFDEGGREIASTGREYDLLTGEGSTVEFPPDEYWAMCKAVITDVLRTSEIDAKDVVALAISSQGETLICLDHAGRPLSNAIVWLDNRSVRQAERIRDHFGAQTAYEMTGQPDVIPTWPATKIMWLKEHQKRLFADTAKFLLLEDYLVHKLTGMFVAEKSLLSSSLLLDITRGVWWSDMLEFIGISPGVLPEIAESGRVVGEITPAAGRETGLDTSTLVVTGALDQVAGMIGAGNLKCGMATETTGTAMAMCVNVHAPPPFDPVVRVPCHYHGIGEKYCLVLWAPVAGMALKWFADEFYKTQRRECRSAGHSVYELMDEEAEAIPAGAEGLVMLPHLGGAACPEFNPHATGVFSGVMLKHTRAHFVRAILESVGDMLRNNIVLLGGLGIEVRQIVSLGGGAESELWNRIKSDITGRPIVTLRNKETACLGAAILAGMGAGVFPSIEAACEKTVSIDRIFTPDSANRDVYDKAFERYLELYAALETFFSGSK